MNQSRFVSSNWKLDQFTEDLLVANKDQKRFGKLNWAIFHGQNETIDSLLKQNTPVDNLCDDARDFRSPLHSSVYSGDVNIVKKLLDRGASPNVFNENRETALMLAAKFQKYEIVDLLLSDRKLKNCANEDDFSHLHIACMRNRVDVVTNLIEHKSDVDKYVSRGSLSWAGYTPLHFAVEFQSIETVQFLVNIGVDITIKDLRDLTALHLADMVRHEQMIDIILEAHYKIVQNPVNSEKLSHYHIACTRDNPEIVACFIANGVTLDEKVDDSASHWSNFTAIDFAIYYDCVENVKLLLREGDRDKFPSMLEINRVTSAYSTGNIELIKLILLRDEFAEVNHLRIDKLPALHFSCIHKYNKSVEDSLSENPSALNEPIWQGSTPLHLTIERGLEPLIKYLLDRGANFNVKNFHGKSSLHLAFERNQSSIVERMLNQLDCITDNLVDDDGLSHFHIACIEDQLAAITRFIILGVDINIRVNTNSLFWPGFTPLHFAAKFQRIEVVRVLLKHGASYAITNEDDLSAFDIALIQSESEYRSEREIPFEIMSTILSHHYKVKISTFNDRGFSPLHILSSNESDQSEAIWRFTREHQDDLNQNVHKMNTRWDGYTPLHFAMLIGHPNHPKLLMQMGADILSKASNGDTPFHLFANRKDIIHITLNPLDFDQMKHNPVGTNGYSLFHAACTANSVECVKYFLNHGVDPNFLTTVRGYEFGDETPLHLVAKDSARNSGSLKLELVTLLLENGASVTARDDRLNTPLHFVTGPNGSEVIDQLISHGADVNARNASLETPLITICENCDYSDDDEDLRNIIVSLLDHGADLTLTDEADVTPLSTSIWDDADKFPSSVGALLKHAIKLQTMESLNSAFKSGFGDENLSSKITRFFSDTRINLDHFKLQCRDELGRLMEVRADNYSSLNNILFKNLNGLSVMSENSELQRLVHSDDFLEKFPIYGPMIKLQLRKGRERSPLLTKSQEVLKPLIKISLPQECLEQILQYLSNEDLKNIITGGVDGCEST